MFEIKNYSKEKLQIMYKIHILLTFLVYDAIFFLLLLIYDITKAIINTANKFAQIEGLFGIVIFVILSMLGFMIVSSILNRTDIIALEYILKTENERKFKK